MKKHYTAIATVTDGKSVWDVTISSHYESYTAAVNGIKAFSRHGYNVVETKII